MKMKKPRRGAKANKGGGRTRKNLGQVQNGKITARVFDGKETAVFA
jgi:hypothetical protein